jgi:2-dehydro-3-deoxyphosphogluconate aldolase/(4S)-4-hydroxy-2-oxoglutarate aldolase
MNLTDSLKEHRVLAIVRATSAKNAVRVARRLVDSGVVAVEVSLTTPDALSAISAIVEEAPKAHVGAGTVLRPADVERAISAGAQYVVTPCLSAAVHEAVRLGVPVAAGAFTPTEVAASQDAGADVVKLFPASLGGPSYLTAIRGPFPEMHLVPVGGVDLASVPAYLTAGAVAVGVGSPLIGDAASGGDLDALGQRTSLLLETLGEA